MIEIEFEKCPNCGNYTLEIAINNLTNEDDGKICMECGYYETQKVIV